MNGHDAGLKGTLTDNATTATFKVAAGALDAGKSVTIGGKDYTIGGTEAEAKALITKAAGDGAKADASITIDGTTYTYKTNKINGLIRTIKRLLILRIRLRKVVLLNMAVIL